jgi:hypothetical protein
MVRHKMLATKHFLADLIWTRRLASLAPSLRVWAQVWAGAWVGDGGENHDPLTARRRPADDGGVLRLKLNADWVVLSVCNTTAGAGAGAEAASGLGRAFFYAGSRSLLVSN